MARHAAVALLLLSVAALGFAARVPDRLTMNLESRSKSNSLNAMKWIYDRKGKGGPIYEAIRYEVAPHLHDKFMQQWERAEDYMRDKEKGLQMYVHFKTLSDNLYFWSYQEWDSWEDLVDHWESEKMKDFYEFIEGEDIMAEWFPLEAAGDVKREYRASRTGDGPAQAARAAAAKAVERRGRHEDMEDFDPRDNPMHVMIQLHVPPSRMEDFEDAFEEIQDRVVNEEDENKLYSLRKFANVNHRYMLCGCWDTMDAWLDHYTSKSFRKLREFAEDNEIEWHSTALNVLGSSENK